MRLPKQLDIDAVQPRRRNGSGSIFSIVAVCIAIVIGITASVLAWQTMDPTTPLSVQSATTVDSNDAVDSQPSTDSVTQRQQFPTTIHKPTGPPRVSTGTTDPHGNAISVACSTCHATRQPNPGNKTVADMNEFHIGMKLSHGNVSCLSCHNSDDYDALKLADGSRVEFVDVMTLCAQCHGPQAKDYKHGAHGGMNGFWDKTRGPTTKNNCVDCHLPHAPQFPKMQPTFKPKDRFLNDQNKAAH